MKIRKSLVVLQRGLSKVGEKLLLKNVQIARMGKEFLWIVGHSKTCLIELVEIIRNEIMVLNAVILMLLRKQQKHEKRHFKSQNLGQRGRNRRQAAISFEHLRYRTFR
jgi:hypothetical protein